MNITTKSLAYWYFRLNGFLTIENLVVHVALPRSRGRQATDVDILGVRFPYRSELKLDSAPMLDDELFLTHNRKPHIALAEVKRSECKLNGPWTDKERKNMQRVLYTLGAFPEDHVDTVAKALYSTGVYSDDDYHVTFICVGEAENKQLLQEKSSVPQITWDSVLSFIHKRFIEHNNSKRSHSQWNPAGRYLWKTTIEHRYDVQSFIDAVKKNI